MTTFLIILVVLLLAATEIYIGYLLCKVVFTFAWLIMEAFYDRWRARLIEEEQIMIKEPNIQPIMIADAHGNKSWHREGKLHRENDPAFEWEDGRKELYRDGINIDEATMIIDAAPEGSSREEHLIDPENPLGYETPGDVNFDHINQPCHDFQHTLAWIFWRACAGKDRGGNFEHVRHLRHMMLSALENRGSPPQDMRTRHYAYEIQVLSKLGFLSISFVRKNVDNTDDIVSVHVLSGWSIVDSAIREAMELNRNLREWTPISPFGPEDVVMPGNYVHSRRSRPRFRTVRLAPSSTAYTEAAAALAAARTVFHIQMLIGRQEIAEMTPLEFNRFIHLAAARWMKLAQSD